MEVAGASTLACTIKNNQDFASLTFDIYAAGAAISSLTGINRIVRRNATCNFACVPVAALFGMLIGSQNVRLDDDTTKWRVA